jgi:hypothetical protein
MGKVKLQMKKLEEENNWRSTFAKRGNGVLKKACDFQSYVTLMLQLLHSHQLENFCTIALQGTM